VCPCSRQLRGRAQPWGPLSERPMFRQPRNRATSRARPDRLPDCPDRSRRPVRERSYPALLCSHLQLGSPPISGFKPQKSTRNLGFVLHSPSAEEFANDLGGIIHHRDYPRIIEPRRANHAEYADDTAGAITVRRDDGGGSREREQFVLRADEDPSAFRALGPAEKIDHATLGLGIVEQQSHP